MRKHNILNSINKAKGPYIAILQPPRVRANAQTALSDEMQLKAKREASKRVSAKPERSAGNPRTKYYIAMALVGKVSKSLRKGTTTAFDPERLSGKARSTTLWVYTLA